LFTQHGQICIRWSPPVWSRRRRIWIRQGGVRLGRIFFRRKQRWIRIRRIVQQLSRSHQAPHRPVLLPRLSALDVCLPSRALPSALSSPVVCHDLPSDTVPPHPNPLIPYRPLPLPLPRFPPPFCPSRT
ncbi:hypothetical protein PFISCL1PPCAC_26239, partial [Pristionchus fissidentatus]